jgi:hypothetical protein
LVKDHARYREEILQLRAEQAREWESASTALLATLDEARAG